MRRRDLIKGIVSSVISWPLRVGAQQALAPAVGFLSANISDLVLPRFAPAFVHGLSESGFIDGQNITIEYRWASNQYDRLPALAQELVRRPVTVIVAVGGTDSALAAKAATPTIPVIFNLGADPVKLALVASLNRPGGNITGVNYFGGRSRSETARNLARGAAHRGQCSSDCESALC
jgi:putative tryptophan/tyrosine transport system substrate-binding protein